ncbi:hypothetical protein [Desulfoplanes sp.]
MTGLAKERPGVPEVLMEENKYVTPEIKKNLEAALTWIKPHWDELVDQGWTWDRLFCMGNLPYPLGKWGVAWFSLWNKENREIGLSPEGNIVCTLHEPGGTVIQTMRKDLIA